jgi:hypothetical protein
LNNCRFKDGLCPSFFGNKGALFVVGKRWRFRASALNRWLGKLAG